MSDDQPSDIFVERISNVSHANGVFRITLGVNDSPNEIRPVTRLMVPANQLGPMLQGIANAAKNIGEQIQLTTDGDPSPQVEAEGQPSSKKKAPPKKSSRSKK